MCAFVVHYSGLPERCCTRCLAALSGWAEGAQLSFILASQSGAVPGVWPPPGCAECVQLWLILASQCGAVPRVFGRPPGRPEGVLLASQSGAAGGRLAALPGVANACNCRSFWHPRAVLQTGGQNRTYPIPSRPGGRVDYIIQGSLNRLIGVF